MLINNNDMDIRFQDSIDEYLLGRMDDADREAFMKEVELEDDKREQLEFTQKVMESVCSREDKLHALGRFRQQYEEERNAKTMRATGTDCATWHNPVTVETGGTERSKKRILFWISGVAALFVIGLFAIRSMFVHDCSPNSGIAPLEQMRGGDDVFYGPVTVDSTENDTTVLDIENTETSDE